MKILFHTPSIDIRGTCVSLYDYAHYHETLHGGKSTIITARNGNHDECALVKFTKRFRVIYYDSVDQLCDLSDLDKDFDIFYTIKYGKNDGILVKNIKSVIHCVFDLSEPHGDVYAAVSDTLAKKFGKTTFVPHMIGLKPSLTKENMRKSLGIPSDAIVFGRHGGLDTFDLKMAFDAIKNIVTTRSDIYFILVNTVKFYNHPHIIHIDKIVDMDEKNRFICSCDAMIHAQSLGETFGIAIGEFSVNNKPIISYNGPVWNDNYKTILKDKALWYTTQEECFNIMNTFDPEKYKNMDMNCYRDYSPEKVMKIFNQVFVSEK